MKIRPSSLYTGPKWLTWSLLIIIIFLISCFIYMIYLYIDLKDSKTAGYEETKQQLLKANTLNDISKVETFHGDEAYHVVFGTDDQQDKIIFYPLEGKEKNLTTVNQSEIISKDAIINEWEQQCSDCELVKVTPALVEDNKLWELTYIDASNRYVLDYVSIYDGSRYEQYRLKSMFN
ncbi:cell wall elongation regulator TseB-like domain-containing protein [Virgibacillus salexigens]|uniref:cell wall elongation regulator TseB-like domain-containing protein n=2 Tax=Virgibacillus salexigens TaxID=61016 RepID=UPI00190D444E